MDDESFAIAAPLTRELQDTVMEDPRLHAAFSNDDLMGVMLIFQCANPDPACLRMAALSQRVDVVISGTVARKADAFEARLFAWDAKGRALTERSVTFARLGDSARWRETVNALVSC